MNGLHFFTSYNKLFNPSLPTFYPPPQPCDCSHFLAKKSTYAFQPFSYFTCWLHLIPLTESSSSASALTTPTLIYYSLVYYFLSSLTSLSSSILLFLLKIVSPHLLHPPSPFHMVKSNSSIR